MIFSHMTVHYKYDTYVEMSSLSGAASYLVLIVFLLKS